MDLDLAVEDWPVGGRTASTPAVQRVPVEEGAPPWWGAGENAEAFLAAQGIVLP